MNYIDSEAWHNEYKETQQKILAERTSYFTKNMPYIKLSEMISLVFLGIGIITLVLVYFTKVTLIQTTCFFVISYTIRPSDGYIFLYEIQCLTEDLVRIRTSLDVLAKNIFKKNKDV